MSEETKTETKPKRKYTRRKGVKPEVPIPTDKTPLSEMFPEEPTEFELKPFEGLPLARMTTVERDSKLKSLVDTVMVLANVYAKDLDMDISEVKEELLVGIIKGKA
jgi:hypothetical protein